MINKKNNFLRERGWGLKNCLPGSVSTMLNEFVAQIFYHTEPISIRRVNYSSLTVYKTSSLYTITVLNFLRIYFFNLYKPFSSVAYTVSVNEL